ncbi:di-heme oxidoredictase family protein [Corallococcus sp. CA047B]|uniref:di-heme oxidoreductase family protein n=1 Tax=Corallococcus sp. CA047B TaxID=2316729 RepID=UPI001F2D0FF3|nr:di-heme oxidoredictase family protein [Corallococcus sp. CA047B]
MPSSRNRWWMTSLGAALGLLLSAAAPPPEPDLQAPAEDPRKVPAARSGGATTVYDTSHNAFGRALANMDPGRWTPMADGKRLFMKDWSRAPQAVAGPLSNAVRCNGCHFKDGRGRPLAELGTEAPLLVRLSVPSRRVPGGVPEPTYGGQFNDRSIPGVPAEGALEVAYAEVPGTYPDGAGYVVRRPDVRLARLAYGKLAAHTQRSARISSPVFGLGLLEAVPEEDILALADPDDRDGDGVSGRPNRVVDARTGAARLGRFGWKANQPSVRQQAARAFSEDLGLTSPLYPERTCTAKQARCRAQAAPEGPVLDDAALDSVTLYLRVLAVPARRDVADPTVVRGQALFQQVGCATCHRPTLRTGDVADLPELSRQDLQPFTDLLLHDMGEGLADGRPDAEASGSEWRTPPLWGLGLLEAVNRQVRMLHDGRARTFEEAILWHGGEAAGAKERFTRLERGEREALVTFLRSL